MDTTIKQIFNIIECYIDKPEDCANAIAHHIKQCKDDPLQLPLQLTEVDDAFIAEYLNEIERLSEWRNKCMEGPTRERIQIQIDTWTKASYAYLRTR